ncbi:MAG: type II secretion system protein [Planctomycetota bacterium]|nr:type II secretion system protein [Planctomycetota bacterium]
MPARPIPAPRGFTLIELILVIGMVALLVGMLIPALAGAARASRATACLSNQRQIGVGAHMFAGDHRDRLPRAGENSDRDEARPWASAIRPYVDSAAPAERTNDRFANVGIFRDPGRARDTHAIHYVVNAFRVQHGRIGGWQPAREWTSLASVARPDAVVYLNCFGDDADGALAQRWYPARGEALLTDREIASRYAAFEPENIGHAAPLSGTPRGTMQKPTPPIVGLARHGTRGGGLSNGLFFDGRAKALESKAVRELSLWDDGGSTADAPAPAAHR